MAERPQKTIDIFVDTKFGPEKRREIGEAAIKLIKERTNRGKGAGNENFQQSGPYTGGRKNSRTYADNYIEHNDFKTAGKRKSPINLRLTGDMMDSLEVVDTSLPGRVRIGYAEAGDESDKAWFNEEKGYKFLELTNDERDKVVRQVGRPSAEEEISRVTEAFARRLARGLFGDNR